MLVMCFVALHAHPGDGRIAALGGIVVACPDLDLVGEGEEFHAGVVEVVGAAAGEVAAGCADVCVEDGVAAEDVFLSSQSDCIDGRRC